MGMKAKYVVVEIGCIECGLGSDIVGVFVDLGEAQSIADRLNVTHSWRHGGQNEFEVFELPREVGVIAEQYARPPE